MGDLAHDRRPKCGDLFLWLRGPRPSSEPTRSASATGVALPIYSRISRQSILLRDRAEYSYHGPDCRLRVAASANCCSHLSLALPKGPKPDRKCPPLAFDRRHYTFQRSPYDV